MFDTERKRKGLWKTMSVNMIIEIYHILKWLGDKGALEENKRDSYFGDCLIPENFMEYAQDVADDDKIWDRLPESWEVDSLASKELQARVVEAYGGLLGFEPSDTMTLSKNCLRRKLRLLLTLSDENVKTPQQYKG